MKFSPMPDEDVSVIESQKPGFLDGRIAFYMFELRNRLRVRYNVTFPDPLTDGMLGWLADLVTPDAYLARGVNPQDPTFLEMKERRTEVRETLAQAANSLDGLLELGLIAPDLDTSAVTKGGTYAYSEADAYAWMDKQAEAVRNG
jgi:hypothetical protein